MNAQDLKAKTGEFTLSEELAVDRNVMALDRTLLAWVRTSLTLIAFGFTAYHLFQFVHTKQGVHLLRPESPRNIGLFLEVLGTLSLLLMMIDYVRMKRVLNMVCHSPIYMNPHFLSASAVFLLGVILITALIFNWSLL